MSSLTNWAIINLFFQLEQQKSSQEQLRVCSLIKLWQQQFSSINENFDELTKLHV